MSDYDSWEEGINGYESEFGSWEEGLNADKSHSGSSLDGDKGESSGCSTVVDGPLAILGDLMLTLSPPSAPFTFGGPASSLPSLPGLVVRGVGAVALPVLKGQALQQLVSLAEKSPYGTETATLVDESVRKTWQISPEKVSFDNPSWLSGIDSLATEVAEKLQMKGVKLDVKLYKLLIYEAGGHFIKHRDTEKEDRMFATLVIQLPSAHKGGDLVVYQKEADGRERQTVHDFGKKEQTSAYAAHYAVHYADAEHAITPVTEGVRVALVYSICWPASMASRTLTPAPTEAEAKAAAHLARELGRLGRQGTHFHYFLEHEYTPKSITQMGVQALKGKDRERFEFLLNANELVPELNHKFSFYLARAQLSTSYLGAGGGSWYKVWGPEEKVSAWHTFHGSQLSTRSWYYVASENTLNPEKKSPKALWHGHRTTEYQGYTGNEGPTKDTTYHKWMLVALPCNKQLQLLAGFLGRTVAMKHASQSGPTTERAIGELFWHKTLQYGIEGDGPPSLTSFTPQLMNNALANKYSSLLPKALAACGVPITSFETMVQLMQPPFWGKVKGATLNKLAQGKPEHGFKLIEKAREAGVPRDTWETLLPAVLNTFGVETTYNQHSSACQAGTWTILLDASDKEHLQKAVSVCAAKSPEVLESVVDAILKCSSHPGFQVADFALVLNVRKTWLERNCAEPETSWRMPDARFPEQSAVEEFLRGHEQCMTLTGVFRGLPEARAFVRRHTKAGNSFVMKEGGRGAAAFVQITKTPDYFWSLQRVARKNQQELQLIDKALGITGGNRGGADESGPTGKRARDGEGAPVTEVSAESSCGQLNKRLQGL